MEPILEVEVESTGASWSVRAPAVGWWIAIPGGGDWVGPGACVGRLRRLRRNYRLVLPAGVSGRVASSTGSAHRMAVGAGDELLRLEKVEAGAAAGEPATTGATEGLAAGHSAVLAGGDGVFYARPTPDAPPFVVPGARIRRGEPVGLVEVMKTFSPVPCDGPGVPDEAEVVELRVTDGDEISLGQVLVVLRPIAGG